MLNNISIDYSRLSEPKKSKNEEKDIQSYKFHQIIEKDKKFILNYYRKLPYFKDSMDELEKESRGNFYYRRMVKNGLKNKSSFIKVILQSIKKVNQQKKIHFKPKKLKNLYKVPLIEIVKNEKKQIVERNKIKELENQKINILKRQYSSRYNDRKANSLILVGKSCVENINFGGLSYNKNNSNVDLDSKNRLFSGKTNLENISTKNNSRNNSGNKNRLLSGITHLGNISAKNKKLRRSLSSNSELVFKDDNIIFLEERIRKFNDLLNKCEDEISHGNKIKGKFEKFSNRLNEKISSAKQERNNKEDNNIQDQKIVEDKINPKKKYKIMEIEKYKILKKRIDAKISDNYAYLNRSEFKKFIKNRKKNEEYDLYLDDINKINEKLKKKKIKEKEKLYEIESLLDDVYKKKNYLKNKLNIYNGKNKREKEKEEYIKNNLVFDDDYFLLDEKRQEEHKGSLVPKLLSKREENTYNKIS